MQFVKLVALRLLPRCSTGFSKSKLSSPLKMVVTQLEMPMKNCTACTILSMNILDIFLFDPKCLFFESLTNPFTDFRLVCLSPSLYHLVRKTGCLDFFF